MYFCYAVSFVIVCKASRLFLLSPLHVAQFFLVLVLFVFFVPVLFYRGYLCSMHSFFWSVWTFFYRFAGGLSSTFFNSSIQFVS